ncbi:D-alanyl-D-alanine carboxypeptidase [Azospirillaceae bacterium]
MSITSLIPIPPNINPGISNAKQKTMLSLLGAPRDSYGSQCDDLTNPKISRLIVHGQNVGPFKATGLRPAVTSLKAVMANIAKQYPEIYVALGSAGMLCVRRVKGSNTAISNHSWGTAIDLTLNGQLDCRGDNQVQQGLADIAPIFNDHGWFWGAGFSTEDAMHFECGDDLIRQWHAQKFFEQGAFPDTLMLGDRGPDVRTLQTALIRSGIQIKVDGIYGPDTQKAVKQYQNNKKIPESGEANAETLKGLGL